MSWFRKSAVEENQFIPPNKSINYPMWTFVKIHNKEEYWLLLAKTKMQFISLRAFESWHKPYVIASKESISAYNTWKKVGFSLGTIVCNQADGKEWYITGNDLLATERRLITTPDFFDILGFNRNNIVLISAQEVDFHKRAEDIV